MIDHKEKWADLGLPITCQHLINGEFVGGEKEMPMIDPATAETIGAFPQAEEAQIEDAIAAAQTAQKRWWALNVGKRKAQMRKVLQSLKKAAPKLSLAESINVGIPQMVSQQVTTKALLRNWEYYAEWVDKIESRVVQVDSPSEVMNIVLYEPLGVAAVIIPWNTPNLFLGSKVAPALAAGCSVIIKPSENASLSAYLFAETIAEAGLPKGLVQVLFGDREVGAKLCEHEKIEKLAFTGGTEIGKKVMAQSSSTLKRLTLELGGKSPHIIFPDANLQQAVMMATFGVFGLSGQACTAGSRLYVHNDIWDLFLEQFKKFASTLSVGDPLNLSTMMGPLISQAQQERAAKYVEMAKEAGGEVLTGGEPLSDLAPGFFYKPTILTGVPEDAVPAQEEIFGPVSLLFPFKDEEELIQRANATRYGLAAGVWTNDLNRALRVVRKLDAGIVWVNTYNVLPYQAPFGGFKESGFGKDGGRDALFEHLREKNIYIRTG